MINTPIPKSGDISAFSQTEIDMYNSQLERIPGAKQAVINKAGISNQTYYRAMRGEKISLKTKKSITHATLRVIKEIQS